MTAATEAHVAHGYTIDDLDKMSRAAAIADRSMALDYADKTQIAWSAIAEELCAADEPPIRQALIRVGWQAIYRTVRDTYRSHGIHDDGHVMPRFMMWWSSTFVAPSPEDRIVEGIAAGQLLDLLGAIYRDAVVALAVHGDYQRAADSLGIRYSTFTVRLSTARKKMHAAWHQGETPRPLGTDRRVESRTATLATHCSAGHEWTPENTTWHITVRNGRRYKRRWCRACGHDRGVRRRAGQQP